MNVKKQLLNLTCHKCTVVAMPKHAPGWNPKIAMVSVIRFLARQKLFAYEIFRDWMTFLNGSDLQTGF